MADAMNGLKIAFLCAQEGTERVELEQPWDAVTDAGATAELISTDEGEIQTFDHLEKAATYTVDHTASEVSADDYDALVLPGGVANPDQLRMSSDAVAFAKGFFDQGKPVAVICHGPWTLIEADVVDGRTLTSWPSLQTDLRNAGANWVDEQVHIDREGGQLLISSRNPDDLDAFGKAILEEFPSA